MARDYQPRPPKGGTAGTGNGAVLVGRGGGFERKICASCDQEFSVPVDSFAKSYAPKRDHRGQEVPDFWYAMTRQTRINGTSVYKTPRLMLQMEAAAHFESQLAARNTNTNALDSRTILVALHRRIPLDSSEFALCRKCKQLATNAKAKAWRKEEIRVRDGKSKRIKRKILPNKTADLPIEFSAAKGHGVTTRKRKSTDTPDEIRIWSCAFPSKRGDSGFVMRTDKPMTEKDARVWFRDHSGRGNLSGCSVY